MPVVSHPRSQGESQKVVITDVIPECLTQRICMQNTNSIPCTCIVQVIQVRLKSDKSRQCIEHLVDNDHSLNSDLMF